VTTIDTDLLIIGAGPTGLFATYYAGFRGLRVVAVDSLPALGGQITAMFPEKSIYDIAGFPQVKGRALIDGLVEQAAVANPTYLLGRTATTLRHTSSTVVVELDDGTGIEAKAVIITAGIGRFTPRPLAAGEGWQGRGLEFFVSSLPHYAGKDVVIVGGGDSACDWALHLEPIANSVAVVHRRDSFRAHARTVQQLQASSVELVTRAQVTRLMGNGALESVEITAEGGPPTIRDAQAVVAALGFVTDLGALRSWGLTVDPLRRHILVDTAMRTNLPRVFSAGDITEYPGKVRLITVGFGEAATAVNNAAVVVDPAAQVFPGHSTEAA
jgi:thioredoxin reductase (NADPH)